jgi:hypothetical protein
MMISSEGTQFGLDLGVVEVDGGDLQTAKLLPEARCAQARQFCGFAQLKLANLEESDSQLKPQPLFDGGARPSACQQKIVRITHSQLSHEGTLSQTRHPVNGVFERLRRTCRVVAVAAKADLWVDRAGGRHHVDMLRAKTEKESLNNEN